MHAAGSSGIGSFSENRCDRLEPAARGVVGVTGKEQECKSQRGRAAHKELATTYLRPSGACPDARITEGGRGQASFSSQCGWRLSGPTCESAPGAGVRGLPP